MNGEITKVDDYGDDQKPVVFVLVDNEGNKKKFEYQGYLPIRQGDIVSIEEDLGEDKKRYSLDEKPLVYIPRDQSKLYLYFRNALISNRKKGIKSKKYPMNIGEQLYKEMIHKLEDHEKILNFLDTRKTEYYVTVDDKELQRIYDWWDHHILKRQLYLLGLYNTEITNSGLASNVLFEKLKDNASKVHSLDMEKVFEINQLFGKKTERLDINCGGILRKLVDFKKRGWFYAPIESVKKIYPSVDNYMDYLTKEYDIVHQDNRLYTVHNYQVEEEVADYICRFLKTDRMVRNTPTVGKKQYKVYGSLELTNEQEEALQACMKYQICIVTGGAGCGKTTLLQEIVKNLENRGNSILLTSFTGKAVLRIKEVVDMIKKERCATTSRIIHKRRTRQKIPYFDTVIIDEASMISTNLLHTFFSLFNSIVKMVLIGDCNQLDPVEAGSFFKELIDTGLVPTYYLTKNMRTGDGSIIVKNASALVAQERNYKIPFRFLSGEGLYVLPGDIDLVGKIVKGLSKAGVEENSITILSPVNRYIPDLIRFHQKYYLKKNDKFRFKDFIFYYGDRMMQKKNYYSSELEIMNGEEGYITNINEDYVEVTYSEQKVVAYRLNSQKQQDQEEDTTTGEELTINSIVHSFAKTIHKSQGSEYDNLIIYIPSEQYRFVTVNMLYTAVTRARKKVWIVGERSIIDMITTQTLPARHETLGERIKKKMS